MLDQATQFPIIEKANAAGMFYTDEFEDHCRDEWLSTFPAVNEKLQGQGDRVVPQGQEYHQLYEQVRKALATSPRGTWTIVGCQFSSGKVTYNGMIADGAGDYFSIGIIAEGAGDNFTLDRGNIHFNNLINEMVSREIYKARQAYDRAREFEKARANIAAHGYHVGRVLKNIKCGRFRFSTAIVTEIDANGCLHMDCTRRGSKYRYTASVYAHNIEQEMQPSRRSRDVHQSAEPETAMLF